MEKISRIVGGSQRVASVDLKNTPAVRPGTPTFGRPVGNSTQTDHDSMTTAQKAVELMVQRDDKKAAETRDTQMVRQMANNFFMSHTPSNETEDPVKAEAAMDDSAGAEIEVPEKYTPRGSYVDVRA
jgi:hypothetical protein